MKTIDYEPVACQFYDQLELIAIRKHICTIEFVDVSGNYRQVETKIKDLYTENQEEFLKIEDNLVIRLDHISKINGTVALLLNHGFNGF